MTVGASNSGQQEEKASLHHQGQVSTNSIHLSQYMTEFQHCSHTFRASIFVFKHSLDSTRSVTTRWGGGGVRDRGRGVREVGGVGGVGRRVEEQEERRKNEESGK